ncbi:hypothetical protein EWM64_g5438 [Hericium alpestre]|uniref:Alcohol acetyltransferase n=1 Tax=Hericium alpestre TaxID=135208 RepID=A0A4Y9ZYJ6_9AGAM|nr:hypothetical protein EWM64_g5438 [Hericium alpestre]
MGFYYAVGMTSRFHPPAGRRFIPSLLYEALKSLIGDHAALGVSVVEESTDNPRFIRLPRIDLREVVSFVQLPENADYEHEFTKLTADRLSSPFDGLGRLPLWRLDILTPGRAGEDSTEANYVDIALFIHHGIVDGGAAAIFQQCLLSALQSANPPDDVHPVIEVPELPMVPSIHSLLRLPTSPLAVAKALWRSWFPRNTKGLWTGAPVSATAPILTHFQYFALPPPFVTALSNACKAKQTTVTALLEAAVARAMFAHLPTDGTADKLTLSCPINLRRFIADIGDRTLGVFVASDTHTFTRTETDTWSTAQRIKRALATKLAAGERNLDTGMLKYVRHIRAYLLDKAGAPRDTSLELSNVGIIDGNADADDAVRWRMSRVLFSQSASVTGAAVQFSVATVRGGEMCVAVNWQDGVVDAALPPAVMAELKRTLEELASA